jgi:hypothetical protein
MRFCTYVDRGDPRTRVSAPRECRKIPAQATPAWTGHPRESKRARNPRALQTKLLLYRVPGLQDEFHVAFMVQAHGAVEVNLLQRKLLFAAG